MIAIEGDLRSLVLLEEKLDAVDGTEVGVSRPSDDPSDPDDFGTPLGSALVGAGLARTGVRAFRNSV